MSMFKRVAANSEAATKILSQVVEVQGRTNYNEMVAEYNQLGAGDFLMFPWERDKTATLSQNLAARNLTRDVDFTLAFVNSGTAEAPKEEVILKRVSEKAGVPVVAAKRGPKAGTPRKAAEGKAETKPAAPKAAK